MSLLEIDRPHFHPHPEAPLADLGNIGLKTLRAPEDGHVVLEDRLGNQFPLFGGDVLSTPIGPTDFLAKPTGADTGTGEVPTVPVPDAYTSMLNRLDSQQNIGEISPEDYRRRLEILDSQFFDGGHL